jgi:hypothetical protein
VKRAVEPGDGIDASSDRARFEQMLARHHRKLPRRFENDAHEATWLFRVTYRCCLDELRSRRRRPESPTAELQLSVVGSEPHRLVVVEEACRSLDPADRAVHQPDRRRARCGAEPGRRALGEIGDGPTTAVLGPPSQGCNQIAMQSDC